MYTLLQQFGGFDSVWMPMVATSTVFGCRWWPLRQCLDADCGHFDSVWMPMVATSKTYIESKIQGHLWYQFCFCINTVVTIIFHVKVCTFLGPLCILLLLLLLYFAILILRAVKRTRIFLHQISAYISCVYQSTCITVPLPMLTVLLFHCRPWRCRQHVLSKHR